MSKLCVYERIAIACQAGKGVRLSWDDCVDLYVRDDSFRSTAQNRKHSRLNPEPRVMTDQERKSYEKMQAILDHCKRTLGL